MKQVRVCRRCHTPVIETDTPGYSYCCPEHDEDLYEFETELEDVMESPEYPLTDIKCKLINTDGNAFALISRVREALRRGGRSDLIEQFTREAMNGNYDNVIATCLKFVDVE